MRGMFIRNIYIRLYFTNPFFFCGLEIKIIINEHLGLHKKFFNFLSNSSSVKTR